MLPFEILSCSFGVLTRFNLLCLNGFIFAHLADDPTGACNPLEGPWTFVVVPDVIVDGSDEVPDAPKGAPSYLFPGDFGEPAFDLIEPRRAGWREVHMISWAFSQPLLNFRMLVGSVVIEHEVNGEGGIDGFINPIEESQKLLMAMPWLAFTNYGSFENVQRSKQSRRPVPLIIMGLSLRQAGP
jgi:hypothetical protein